MGIQRGPKVSVGVPVYNGQDYLEACLRGLLAQTFADFEIIVSDNASTDTTESICRDYAGRDGRIRYVRAEKNQGAAWNYNRVLTLARGDYFKWAAYDDLVSPDLLEAGVRVLDADPGCVIAFGSAMLIDAEGNEKEVYREPMHLDSGSPSERLQEYLTRVGLTNAMYGLMPTSALRAVGGLGSFVNSDTVMLGAMALRGRFRELPEVRFYRRLHAKASAPSNPSLAQLAAWFDPRKKGRPVYPAWRHFAEYASSIRKAPIPWMEKIRCLRVLLSWQRHGLRDLVREGMQAVGGRLPGTGRVSW